MESFDKKAIYRDMGKIRLDIGEVVFIFKTWGSKNSYSMKTWKNLWSRRDTPIVRDSIEAWRHSIDNSLSEPN